MDSFAVERFRELMEQIGDRENFGMVVEAEDRPAWQVVIEETDAPIMLELDPLRRIIVLSSEIGEPKSEHVAHVNALALDYAHLYEATGGARISRSKDDGLYSLIADYGLEALSRDTLGGVLRRFAAMSSGWKDILAGDPKAQATTSHLDFGHEGVFLRA